METILRNIKLAAALGAIKGESTENIVAALSKYSNILKVNLSFIAQNNVDIYDVAKRLNNSIPDEYYDGLEREISEIISELKPQNNDSAAVRPGGGGGGNRGGGAIAVIPQVSKPQEQAKSEISFSDVPENHWAAKSINKLASSGILSGTGAGQFEPNRDVSRAEFVKMLVGAFSITQTPEQKISFLDCSVGDWFYPYIDAAVSCNIAKGVSSELFLPQETIKRQDAALMCANLMTYKSVFKSPGKMSFLDYDEISEYASYAVGQLVNMGVINGFEDNTFRPKDNLTRAQAAIIINTLLEQIG